MRPVKTCARRGDLDVAKLGCTAFFEPLKKLALKYQTLSITQLHNK
jgi:hypothetical protein